MSAVLSLILSLFSELIDPIMLDSPSRLVKVLYRGDFWSNVSTVIPPELDQGWILELDEHILIAHALGNYNQPNTIESAKESIDKGYNFLEVDLFLYKNVLRCHHGPVKPNEFQEGDCDLIALIKIAKNNNARLILDIKSDFKPTFNFLVSNLGNNQADLNTLIFQIYESSDLKYFLGRAKELNLKLNSPIVTMYRNHSHLSTVSRLLPKGIKVITIPLARKHELLQNKNHSKYIIMTHPISDCNSLKHAKLLPVRGFYGPNKLIECKEKNDLIHIN